jgi:hypothetical protein
MQTCSKIWSTFSETIWLPWKRDGDSKPSAIGLPTTTYDDSRNTFTQTRSPCGFETPHSYTDVESYLPKQRISEVITSAVPTTKR